MPERTTIVLMAYAVLLLVASAPLWAVAAVGALAVFWQAMAAASAASVPDALPDSDDNDDEFVELPRGLTPEEWRMIMDEDEDDD